MPTVLYQIVSYHMKEIRFYVLFYQDREPFAVPDEVSWNEMSFALNARWAMTAECDLTQEHLDYLGSKLFQSKYTSVSKNL